MPLPLRDSNGLGAHYRRTLASDGLLPPRIYLRGSSACGSTNVSQNKEVLHNAITRSDEHVAERADVEKLSFTRGQAVASKLRWSPRNSGDMDRKGINGEVFCNATGIVDVGGRFLLIVRFPPDHPPQRCRMSCMGCRS